MIYQGWGERNPPEAASIKLVDGDHAIIMQIGKEQFATRLKHEPTNEDWHQLLAYIVEEHKKDGIESVASPAGSAALCNPETPHP